MDAPWSNKSTLSIKNRMERLSKEILDFEKYIAPTKSEKLNRETLVYSVTQLIESLWPNNYRITAFGSSVTGLLFPSSDVDINIDFDELPKKNKIDILKMIRKNGITRGLFRYQQTTLAANARVPVLMITDDNNVSMDITVQNECFSSDRTSAWLTEYPALKPLFMVLKQSIGNYRVTSHPGFEPLSAKTAGLASYSLICLIISYLQLQVDSKLDPTDPTYYGTLLMGFFDFYSKFKSSTTAISLKDGGAYLSKGDCPVTMDSTPGKLTIVDPDVEGANVARSTQRFNIIQVIFGRAWDELRKRTSSGGKTESMLSSIIKVDNHYYNDPRKEGHRFRARHISIDTGLPAKKNFYAGGFKRKRENTSTIPSKTTDRSRFDDRRNGDRDDNDRRRNTSYKRDDHYRNPYSRDSYRKDPYSRDADQDNNTREYERHKRNHNFHLAEFYKEKSSNAQKRRRY